VRFLSNHLVGFASGTCLSVLLCALTAVGLTAPASANDVAWSFNSNTSSARFYLGSLEKSNSVNAGAARVAGTVNLETEDLNNSVVDLSIYPAGEDWGKALGPDGSLRSGYVPDATDHTLLTFSPSAS
jgi:polyisoprenoid-binding protein YceI